jgi:hypothetical protein
MGFRFSAPAVARNVGPVIVAMRGKRPGMSGDLADHVAKALSGSTEILEPALPKGRKISPETAARSMSIPQAQGAGKRDRKGGLDHVTLPGPRAPRRPGPAWQRLLAAAAVALIAVAAPACGADRRQAVCLVVLDYPEGKVLTSVVLDDVDDRFTMTYVHPVTRTPVEENYRATADGITQTSIAFEQQGSGLPTEGTAGEQWERRDGRFIVTMARKFDGIRMRASKDQSPRLVAGAQKIDLAQWGDRALALTARRCTATSR